MPTIINESVPQSARALPPELLRTRHEWARWRAPLIAGYVGLGMTLLALWSLHLGAKTADIRLLLEVWGAGLLATLTAMLFARRRGPDSLIETARKLDEHLSAKNRLEASAALADPTSPLGRAHRQEIDLYLERSAQLRPVRALRWLAAGLLALLLAHLLTATLWFLPSLQPRPPKPAAPPPEIPTASIDWKTPEEETKANPIEEVPAVAVAKSSSGLKDITLEVSVNGEVKKSTRIPAEPFNKSGSHEIKVSLFMDELGAQPFDIVSYYLRGQRITAARVPPTISAIQFVQVRPFRDDVYQGLPGSGHHEEYDLLIRLKLAQLRSVKENFILAHTDLPPEHPVRQKENTRVAKDQAELFAKTEQVIAGMTQEGMPTEIIDLLRQAQPQMAAAARQIQATQNEQALVPQQKSLNLIAEVERHFRKVMEQGKHGKPPDNPSDPFGDKQKHEMPKRADAPAGQLETLAKNQADVAKDLGVNADSASSDSSAAPGTPDASQITPGAPPASSGASPGAPAPTPGTSPGAPVPPSSSTPGAPSSGPAAQAVDPFGPQSGTGTAAQRQARVLQGLGVLLNGPNDFPQAVKDALATAKKNAEASMKNLDTGNQAGAREPAATAARDLQTALTAMNQTGDETTKEAMDDAQKKLNDLADQLSHLSQQNPADQPAALLNLANQVHDVQAQLENASDQQQQAGSEKGAQQLDSLAKKLADAKIPSELAKMSKTGLDAGRAAALASMLEAMAKQSAASLAGGPPSPQAFAKMINELQRSRVNLERLASKVAAAQMPEAGQPPAQSQRADQGQHQGQGQSPSPSPGQGQGHTPGQGQASSPAQGHGEGQGQGQSSNPGESPGQAQGQGQGEGQGVGTATGQGTAGSGAGSGTPGTAPGSDQPGAPDEAQVPQATLLQAYQEEVANLKNQTQRSAAMLPDPNADAINRRLADYQKGIAYRAATPRDNMHLSEDLKAPLNQLIIDLQAVEEHAERGAIVTMPDLDDTPAQYRPAVSDYFESVSRDYRPPPVPEPAKP